MKKSQHVDTIIAVGRGTAELRKKANYCRMVKKLKTRNEPCGFQRPEVSRRNR